MCKMNNVTIGIKKLDFSSFRGKMAASLTDGRQIIVPLSFFPEIKSLSLKQRSEWMILDDQYFTFADLSKVYSVTELLRQN
ncbi:MAG: hypothetical protein IJP36_00840 [Bacteroides sp.]|nr:hypothetical protein [Bacteroides sp.]